MAGLIRQGHFLGTKLRSLRKRNGLTLDELSARCVQIDAAARSLGVLPEHGGDRQAHALGRDAGHAGGHLQQGRALVPR